MKMPFLLFLNILVYAYAALSEAETNANTAAAARPDCELRKMSEWHPQFCMKGDLSNGTVELSCLVNSLNLTRDDLRDWISRYTRGGGVFHSFGLYRCTLPREDVLPPLCTRQFLVSDMSLPAWPSRVNLAPECPGLPLRLMRLSGTSIEKASENTFREWLVNYSRAGGRVLPERDDRVDFIFCETLLSGLPDFLALHGHANESFDMRINSMNNISDVLDKMDGAGVRPLGNITMNKLELSFDRLKRVPRAIRPFALKHLSLTLNQFTNITLGDLAPFHFLPSSDPPVAERLAKYQIRDQDLNGPSVDRLPRYMFTVNATLDLSFNNPLCHIELGALAEVVAAYGEVRLLNTLVHRRGGLTLLGVGPFSSSVGWFDVASLGERYRWLALTCCCQNEPCRLHDTRLGPVPPCAAATTTTPALSTTSTTTSKATFRTSVSASTGAPSTGPTSTKSAPSIQRSAGVGAWGVVFAGVVGALCTLTLLVVVFVLALLVLRFTKPHKVASDADRRPIFGDAHVEPTEDNKN